MDNTGTSEQSTQFAEKVKTLAEKMVAKDSRLRIAFNEQNQTKEHEPGAQEFLKVREVRLGRDFKLYGLMSMLKGEAIATTDLLAEMVLPLRSVSPEAYFEGLSYLKDQGPVFGDNQTEWEDMLDEMKLEQS